MCVKMFDPCLPDVHGAITHVIGKSTPTNPCQVDYGTGPYLEGTSHKLIKTEN